MVNYLRKGGSSVRTFVVVYASRISNGQLCPDSRGRCDKAIKVAQKFGGTIVIGVGSPGGKDHLLFSKTMVDYLVSRGWSENRILVNPAGWGSFYESKAALAAIEKVGDGRIVIVTAWYHMLRVWAIWTFALGRFVHVEASWKTYPWTNPFRELGM